MMLVVTGEMVVARGGVLLDESDHNATTAQEKKPQPISRMELQKDLMRFSQMFIRDITLKIYCLESQNASNTVRFVLSSGELRTVGTLLHITTGPDAVVNLLDMVIFVTLGRMAVENSWKPELLGKSKGGLPKFTGRWKKRSGPSPERC